MSKIEIFHNPRCSKSRQTLALLEQQNIQAEIIDYLNTPPTTARLKEILTMLNIEPRELLRKGEVVYKEQGLADKSLSNEQLIHAMCEYPKLIERPIVINNGKAKIGRPPEVVLEIL